MKNTYLHIAFISFFTLVFLDLFAQSNPTGLCRNIYFMNFKSYDEKENSIVGVLKEEVESAFLQCKDCHCNVNQQVLSNENIAKLDHLLKPSDTLMIENFDEVKKIFGDNMPETIAFGEFYNEKVSDNIDVRLSFYSLNTRQKITYQLLTLNRNIVLSNSKVREIYIQNFVRSNFFNLDIVIVKKIRKQLYSTIGLTSVGIALSGYGLASSIKIKNDWKAYLGEDPYDFNKKYSIEDKKYVTQQSLIIAGGVLATVGGFFIIKKIKQKKQLKILKELDYADNIFIKQKSSNKNITTILQLGINSGIHVSF